MDDLRCLSRRGFDASDLAFSGKIANYFHTKIYRHYGRTFVMVKKDVVSIRAQAAIPAKKGPDQVERRFERRRNFANCDAPAHRRQNARG
jgi:hypothetical protein